MEASDTVVSGVDDTPRTQDEAIILPSFLDLGYAGTLKSALQEAIQQNGCLTINGAAVESVTSPCIQVLLAADKSLSVFGGNLRLVDASPALESAFADLGLEQIQAWSNTQ